MDRHRRFHDGLQSEYEHGADYGSDYIPVICKLMVKLKKLKQAKPTPRLQFEAFQSNPVLRETYEPTVIPIKGKQYRSKWIIGKILVLMKKRQMTGKHNSREYKDIDKEIKNKCREAKEAWLSGKCEEIERYKNTDPSSMHRKMKELAGKKSCSSGGCLKAKGRTIILEKDKILERWTKYTQELFQDDRGEKPIIRKSIEGPIILKSEVRAAVNKMTKNKAAGPDKIMTEMIVPQEEFGIEKLTDVINEIYDSGEFPEVLSKSIFIALPKKPGAIECELHRTISLMSQITKIILKVIMARARSKLRPEIGKEQCGFVEDSGTRKATWMMRMSSERAVEMQKDMYMCFVDYTKAFDKVQHEELLQTLQRLDMDGKDIRLLRNLYWGHDLSHDLFNLYSELILRELEGLQEFVIGGHNMNNIRYADDTVLISESEGKLQELLDKVVEKSAKKGLTINCKKTGYTLKTIQLSKSASLTTWEVLLSKMGNVRMKLKEELGWLRTHFRS
ncbi:uncharacterized protein LOC119575579 [Penaeus monodon]|uniref:uncharacterized protein LOC119575579 n=1 Tax=Penaeus monodon TaxID=6687 RepID=UPI0018A6EC10|nr:uncharacterized protein LOC119575579 [Penaeus monodon]